MSTLPGFPAGEGEILDPRAFERALSDRLKHRASEEGVDLDRLRKRVACSWPGPSIASRTDVDLDSNPN